MNALESLAFFYITKSIKTLSPQKCNTKNMNKKRDKKNQKISELKKGSIQ